MIRIELTGESRNRQITAKRSGEIINLVEQKGFAFLPGQKYPSPVNVTVPKDEQPKPAGIYTLDPTSFWVNRYGQLEISPRLVLAQPAAAKAA